MLWGISIWCGESAYGVGYQHMVRVTAYGVGTDTWCREETHGAWYRHMA